MTAITESSNDAYRDYAVAGVPASGVHDPVKSAVRELWALIDITLGSLGVNGAITVKKATLALLNADLAHVADTLAVVYNDATSANNGIYAKVGGSGSGSWAITALALPASFSTDLATVLASVGEAEAAAAAAAVDAAAAAASEVSASTDAATATAQNALAQAAAVVAVEARDETLAYAELTGPFVFYATKADANAGLAGLPADQLVQVWADESQSGERTVYKKEGGVYVLQTAMSYLDKDGANVGANALTLRTNIGADLAANVNFTPAGTGGVAATVQNKLRERLTPADKGAVENGSADDTADYVQAAAEADAGGPALHQLADKTARLTSPLDLQHIYELDFKGYTFIDHAGIGITVGGEATNGNLKHLNFNRVSGAAFTSRAAPDLVFQGVKYASIDIRNAPWVRFTADGNVAAAASTYYNDIRLGSVVDFEVTGSNGGSLNENLVTGGRISGSVTFSGDYDHNGWTFNKNDLEGAVTIDLQRGLGIRFIDQRMEPPSSGTATITFGSDTIGCLIEKSFVDGAFDNHVRPPRNWSGLSLTDDGLHNIIRHSSMLDRDRTPLVVLSPATVVFDGGSSEWPTTANITPGFKKLTATGSIVYESGFIPWRKGMTFVFALKNEIWRPTVNLYDDNYTPTVSASDPGYATLTGGGAWSSGASSYTTGSNVGLETSFYAFVAKTDYSGYVKVILEAGSFTTFDYAAVYSVEPYQDLRDDTRLAIHASRTRPMLAAAPTQGYAPLGYQAAKTAGGVWTCTFSAERRLANAAVSTATTIVLNSGTSVAVGDIVGLLQDDDTTLWTDITDVSASPSFTIADALTANAAAGNRCWIGRWV